MEERRRRQDGQFYLHHFYSHQPDLNIGNPQVRHEIAKVAGFWLELGVDGFRVDAVPFLIDTREVPDVDLVPHEILKHLRSFISRRHGDGVLLGQPASRTAHRLLRRRGRRRGPAPVQLPAPP